MRTFLFISCQNYISNVDHQLPLVWSKIIPIIKNRQGNLDGLLLDWHLQQETEAGDYSSASLATHLRVLATQGNLVDLPIVLCSAQDNFAINYKRDTTTHDLFDMVYSKNDLREDQTQLEFIALANGYKVLNKAIKTACGILGIAQNEYESLDVRFQAEFNNFFEIKSPSHQIARFLLHEVIEYQGILVDENVLAARLGVDKSSPDWDKLKEILSSYQYKGVFDEAWERWWWFGVESWWKTNFAGKALRSSSASKRVEYLKESFMLQNLVPSAKTPRSKSDSFWTVCYYAGTPLDTIDGFTLLQDETIKAWQEKRYVSLDYALENKVAIATIEKPRFTKLKETYVNR